MALNANQIADILFKKVAAGKATTEFGRFFGNGEEGYSGRSFVDLSQIWAQSDLIPNVAAPVANVVELISVQLVNIPGSNAFAHATLKNVIPFNYGDGSSYAYTLKASNNSTIIPPGVNDWFLDTETGVLTFFAGDDAAAADALAGELPAGVTVGAGPWITAYKYIGKTAKDTGLSGGGGSTISMGEWQDSVDSLITVLPSTPANGDRYIFNATSGVSASIIDPATEVVTVGTINPYDIIEWTVAGSTSGWVATTATMGMFTSIDTLANAVHFFNTTTKWTKYEGEKTYPTELVLVPQDTFAEASGYDHVISDTQIVSAGTPSTDFSLSINGIKIKDAVFSVRSLTSRAVTFASATNNSVTFSSIGAVAVGDPIRITTATLTIWRVVTSISTDTVSFTGSNIASITGAQVYLKSSAHTFPEVGDYILIHDGLGYDVDGIDQGNGDELAFNYVRPNA